MAIQKVRLGNLCEFMYGKGLPKSERVSGEFPVYGSGGIVDYHKNYYVKGPGIIVGRKGSIGSVFFEKRNFYPIDTVFYITENQKVYDLRFLYYSLLTLGLDKLNTDAAVPGLNRNVAYEQKFLLPDIPTQQKIAFILSAYDDLIENNLKRIKILEEMAQMIYREWFVNFRFPGHEKVKMVKSELGMIPEGWEIIKLGEMLEFQKGKKAKNIYHQPLNNSIPYLLIDGLRNRSFLYTDDKTMPIAKKDNILMVMDGASSGQVFIGFEGAVGSTIGIYRIKDTNNLFSYLVYFFLKNNFKTISEKNIGSAIPHANKDFIASMKIVTPKSNIVILFSDFVFDIFKQIDVLERKILNLRKTRDLFLPKLISGEIDVENVDIKASHENN